MSQPLIWHSLNTFRKLCCALPHGRAVALGAALGGAVAHFSGRKVGEAVQRCKSVLNVSSERAYEIVTNSYRHFGGAAAEFARITIVADHMDTLVRCSGMEYLSDAVASGRGAFLATAHIGNWEYAAAYLAHHGLPINGLGTDQRDARITKLISELRAAGGVKPLGKASDLRAMIAALKKGEIIAIPVDQDAKEHGVLSPFLGRPASTPVGAAKLAAKLGCDVLTGACVKNADGIYDMKINPPLKGRNKPFGVDIQTSIDDMNAEISQFIFQYPDQWMWMYPRWESYERGIFNKQ